MEGSDMEGIDMEDMEGMMREGMMDESGMDPYGDEYGHEGSPGMNETDSPGNYEDGMEDGDDTLNFEGDPNFENLPPLDRMRKIRRDIL